MVWVVEHVCRFAGVLWTSWAGRGRSALGAIPLGFTTGDGETLDEGCSGDCWERQGVAAVPDDFRSSFRDWAAGMTDHPREVIEVALARSKVEAAYSRSDLLERCQRLMDHLAEQLARRGL